MGASALLDPATGRPWDRRLTKLIDPSTDRPFREPRHEADAERISAVMHAPAHVRRSLERARELRGPFEPRGSLNTWQETLYSSIATETALTAAAEAVVYPASSTPGYYGLIPGQYMIQHRSLRLRMAGQLSTAATPGTFLWRLRWGGVAGTALVASGGAGATGTALTMSASQTNVLWRCDLYITCRAEGSGTAGSLFATGEILSPGIPTTNISFLPANTPAAVGVDTTTSKDLAFTHTPSLSTASLAGMQYHLVSMN